MSSQPELATGKFRRLFTLPSGLSPGRRYLEECESVRGWAIILVFLFHWQGGIRGYDPIEGQPSLLLSFLYAGSTGVTLFFVLSGFLLSLPFAGASLQLNPRPASGLYLKRHPLDHRSLGSRRCNHGLICRNSAYGGR